MMRKENRVKIVITILIVFAAGFIIGVVGNLLRLETAYIVGLTALAVIAAVALFIWSYGEQKE